REVVATPESIALGRLICVAEWNGHKTRYVPYSMEQKGKETRAKQSLKRLDDHADKVRAELTGGFVRIEHMPEVPMLNQEESLQAEEMLARVEKASDVAPKAKTLNGRPIFASDLELARWVMDHPELATEQDRKVLRAAMNSTFRMLLEMECVDPDALENVITRKGAA
uniref:hypothetical protein n=1 Tax=Telmatospirillum sp. J64-1 TaxID=2502183 RepID=UPI001C8F22A0